MQLLKCSVLLICLVESLWTYEVPAPLISIYKIGFEISLPHKDGINYVSVEAKQNEKITEHSPGTWIGSHSPTCDHTHWIYKNYDAKLNIGDTLFYKILVSKDDKLYIKKDGVFIVEDYAIDTSGYTIPEPRIEAYHKGFEICIPHESGINFVSVNVKCNQELTIGSKADWAGSSSLNNAKTHWVYTNAEEVLNVSDTVYYLICVTKNQRLYQKIGSTCIVPCDCSKFPFTRPNPTIHIYHKGFDVLLPHENGITHVSVEFKINSEITFRNPSTMGGDSSITYGNTHWIYTNADVYLNIGDALYYRIFVTKYNRIYIESDGVYHVTDYSLSVHLSNP